MVTGLTFLLFTFVVLAIPGKPLFNYTAELTENYISICPLNWSLTSQVSLTVLCLICGLHEKPT